MQLAFLVASHISSTVSIPRRFNPYLSSEQKAFKSFIRARAKAGETSE